MDAGKVFFIIAMCLILVSPSLAVYPEMRCKATPSFAVCEAHSTAGHDITWRLYVFIDGEEVQVYENSNRYNLYVRIFVPRAVSVIELEIDGQVLRMYAQKQTKVVFWRYDEVSSVSKEGAQIDSPPRISSSPQMERKETP